MLAVPQPGDVVAGKYEITRLLGRGGMGLVFEAVHRKLDQRVALKFLLADDTNPADSIARFEREARAAARLQSPHVVRVMDVDVTSDGMHFIVMEYLEGHDLAKELRSRSQLPVPEAVDWILQACAGVAEAHERGIVHRDLKPGNLFLAGGVVKVMDFGISKLAGRPGEAELTTTETMLGTPSYMAPEQILSAKTIDHRADVWALGVVLYRVLSGALPFSAPSATALAVAIATGAPVPITEVAPTIPPALGAAVMKCLSREPGGRHADVAALAAAIAPFGSGTFSFEAARVIPSSGRVAHAARASSPSLPSLPSAERDTNAASALSNGSPATPATPRAPGLGPGALLGIAAVLVIAGVGAWRFASPSAASSSSSSSSAPASARPTPSAEPPVEALPAPSSSTVPEPPPTGTPPGPASAVATSRPAPRPAPSAPKPSRSAAPAASLDPLHL